MKTFGGTVIGGNEKTQKLIVQANISFLKLKEKVRYTYMRDPGDDLYAENESLPRNELYQRRIKEDRIKKIKDFIRKVILMERNEEQVSVIFPTSLLLATRIDKGFQIGEQIEDEVFDKDIIEMYIVDGQHRLFAMEELYEDLTTVLPFNVDNIYIKEYLEKYVFNCTILLNFDLWEQAQVFANVNFNQTKVNKSLYYSIYGMNYSSNPIDWNQNYMYIAHSLVKFMNNYEASPLKGCIKMLGTGKGFISQAFFADALMPHIRSPRGIWYVNPEYKNDKPNYRNMSVELISFFEAVKKTLSYYWPQNDNHVSILCKTTGIGALVRLMAYLHQTKMDSNLELELKNKEKASVSSSYIDFITPYLKKLSIHGSRLFGLQGDFAGSGGKGLEHKLFEEMKNACI